MELEPEEALTVGMGLAVLVAGCGWLVWRTTKPESRRIAQAAVIAVPTAFVWAFLRVAVGLASAWMGLALPVGAICILGGMAILLAGEAGGAGIVAVGAACLVLWFAAVLVNNLRHR